MRRVCSPWLEKQSSVHVLRFSLSENFGIHMVFQQTWRLLFVKGTGVHRLVISSFWMSELSRCNFLSETLWELYLGYLKLNLMTLWPDLPVPSRLWLRACLYLKIHIGCEGRRNSHTKAPFIQDGDNNLQPKCTPNIISDTSMFIFNDKLNKRKRWTIRQCFSCGVDASRWCFWFFFFYYRLWFSII